MFCDHLTIFPEAIPSYALPHDKLRTVFQFDSTLLNGLGSLNRYMKQAAFSKSKGDPTQFNPPRFLLAKTYVEHARVSLGKCST